jgi:predicted RNA-binding protein YlxR (DUF448 family)
VGCRRILPQSDLVRCVLGPDGATIGRTAAGRGAWVCSVECVRSAIDRRGFERAWRRRVEVAAVERLTASVAEALGSDQRSTVT